MIVNYNIKKPTNIIFKRYTHTKTLALESKNIITKTFPNPNFHITKKIPVFDTEDRVINYLKEAHHVINALDNQNTQIDWFCAYAKNSGTELKTQYMLFSHLATKKSFPIHTIYNTMLQHKLISPNIKISESMNQNHDCMSFFELKALSQLCSQMNVTGYYYQNSENRPLQIKIDVRQQNGDGNILIYDGLNKRFILKGVDIKLGNLKENRASYIYPIVLDTQDNVIEILNSTNVAQYFAKKQAILTAFMRQVKNDLGLQNQYLSLINTLNSPTISLKYKFNKLNAFNAEINCRYPGSYNSEFIATFEAKSSEREIGTQAKSAYIKHLFENPFYSLKTDQLGIAQYFRAYEKETQNSEIEGILFENRYNVDPVFLEFYEGMRGITKYY